MPLAAGTRLGPYAIASPLGSGGMGEVYRARDTRLGRDVAIKVLPGHLSASAEVRARFEREAKAVSSLNHPHICTLHDVGREGDTDYLVMELVDGETLAQRLTRGALPTAEVFRLGLQIADALDRAHRAGVIHRDLKPGNVMLTRSGAKLMDFGLARAAGAGQGPGGPHPTDLTQSPTVAQPLTAEGTIIGTFQYMAPEQLEGREADARSDIWALGCVLYETATGKRAFEGQSQASLISAIMKDEPAPVSQVTPLSPLVLDRLIQACLSKSPDDRIQTAHDLKLQLQWTSEGGSQAAAAVAMRRPSRQRERIAWTAAAVAALVAAAAFLLPRGPREAPMIRAVVTPPPNAVFLFVGDNAGPPVISPDGENLAFVAVDVERGARLWLRELSSLTARPLPGTDNATYPFWSPDGRSLGFFADQELKRVDVATGQVVGVCPAPGGRGGCWSPDGSIVFAPDFQTQLMQVPAMGGAPNALFPVDTTRHTTHRWPHLLPDGRHFLYYAGSHVNVHGPGNEVWVASIDGRENRMLMPSATEALYADDYIFYVRDSVLVARPFDAGARRFTGDAVLTAERVQFDPTTWKANFSISRDGLLVYQPIGGKQGSQIQLLDRGGHLVQTASEGGNNFSLSLSPDGRDAYFSTQLRPDGDIFAYDFQRRVALRLTGTADDDDLPILSSDGRRVAFTRRAQGSPSAHYEIYVMPVNGPGAVRVLFRQPGKDVWPLDWSADGRHMLVGFGNFSFVAADSVGLVTVDGSATVRWIANPTDLVNYGCFSHDGRWIAYGTIGPDPEIFIEPVGGASPESQPGGRVQVSSRGGSIPVWGGDDRELYFARPSGEVVSVSLAPGTMQPGRETVLFRTVLRPYFKSLDVSDDGQRFLVNVMAAEGAAPIVVVSDWRRELPTP